MLIYKFQKSKKTQTKFIEKLASGVYIRTFLVLSLVDLQNDMGKDRAAAVATMVMAFEADRLMARERERET